MAVTNFGELKKKVVRLTGDTVVVDDGPSGHQIVRGKQLDADILKDACHAALHAITGRQWKSGLFEIAEEGEEFVLPDNLIEVDAVIDNEIGVYIPKVTFELGASSGASSSDGNAWLDTPSGSIVFTSSLSASGAKIYYLADWEQPVYDEDVLECPEFCLTVLTLYAASYCYLRKASQQTDLAQFKTRVDSGTPEDIPAAAQSAFFLKRFENEMTRLPMKQKGSR